jgi:hypothetical protein
MTAPKGTPSFTTPESIAAEETHIDIIHKVLSRYKGITVERERRVSDFCDNYDYSVLKEGRSQVIKSDGGWIYKDGNLVGVAECKYQSSRQNACERAAKYIFVPEIHKQPSKLFISCYGEGFRKKTGGGATGPFIDMAKNIGVSIYENLSNTSLEQEFEKWLKKHIDLA